MLSLFFIEDDTIEFNGHTFRVNTAYDVILRLFALFDDKEVTDEQKLLWACEMLIDDDEIQEKISAIEALELAQIIIERFVMNNSSGEKTSSDDVILFDFEEDSGRIFASFMRDYQINLIEQRGKMKWNVFCALLEGLSDETPFKQAVYYRGCDIPKRTEHNDEERRRIRKMKEQYRLKSERVQRKQAEQAHKKAMQVMADFMK